MGCLKEDITVKTLVVCDSKGNIIFTQTNVTDSYNLIVEDVADNKESIGVDTSTWKCILVDRLATTEEKEALKRNLEAKDKELELQQDKNEKLTDQIIELTAQNLINSEEE